MNERNPVVLRQVTPELHTILLKLGFEEEDKAIQSGEFHYNHKTIASFSFNGYRQVFGVNEIRHSCRLQTHNCAVTMDTKMNVRMDVPSFYVMLGEIEQRNLDSIVSLDRLIAMTEHEKEYPKAVLAVIKPVSDSTELVHERNIEV